MLHRIVMDIVQVIFQVFLIDNKMRPKAGLPIRRLIIIYELKSLSKFSLDYSPASRIV